MATNPASQAAERVPGARLNAAPLGPDAVEPDARAQDVVARRLHLVLAEELPARSRPFSLGELGEGLGWRAARTAR